MSQRRLVLSAVGLSLAAATMGYAVRSAYADGVPQTGALTYAGYLEDTAGKPIEGPQALALRLYAAPNGGTAKCELAEPTKTNVSKGRFEVTLPDTCVAAVKENPELWVDISLKGESLGRTKLGAVPYAIEAGAASEAKGSLAAKLQELAGSITAMGTKVDNAPVPKMTDWVAYTAEVGTQPSAKHANTQFLSGRWRREGDSIRIRVGVRIYLPAKDGVSVSFPPGIVADETKIAYADSQALVGSSSVSWGTPSMLAPDGTRCRNSVSNFEGTSVVGSLECLVPVKGWTTTTP